MLVKCPYCAEIINGDSERCPMCDSLLKNGNSSLNKNENVNQLKNIMKKVNVPEYKKVLTTEQSGAWVERFVLLKKIVAGIWLVLGLIVGWYIGRISLMLDTGGIIIVTLIGGAIGGEIGANSVAEAMLQAVIADQSLKQEELLTRILSKIEEKEDEK